MENSQDLQHPEKKRNNIKMLISLSLTIFLGPGTGHLYLKRFKTAAGLIIVSLIFAVHQVWTVLKHSSITNLDLENLQKTDLASIFQSFNINYPKVVLYYDIAFAAIWAFALVDAYKHCFDPDTKIENTQNNPTE